MLKTDTLESELKEFIDWLSGLSDLELRNFQTLIALPTVLDVLADMPDGQYKKMAIVAMGRWKR